VQETVYTFYRVREIIKIKTCDKNSPAASAIFINNFAFFVKDGNGLIYRISSEEIYKIFISNLCNLLFNKSFKLFYEKRLSPQ
jgi:hypothetical protein